MGNKSKLEMILLVVLICALVVAATVFLPDHVLGTKCMDAWCLN